jgi:hypothetical protein
MKMKPALIQNRANFLINLLDLPSKQSFISHLRYLFLLNCEMINILYFF